jgi:hypothetical protein
VASELEKRPSVGATTVRALLKLIPNVGESLCVVFDHVHSRYAHRAAESVKDIAERSGGPERLGERLAESEELEVLFIEGIEVAARTGMGAKRQLMARVVSRAVEDDAQVEPAQLIVRALQQLDSPDFRALARLRAAEDEAAAVAETTERDDQRGGRITRAVSAAARAEPGPIIAALIQAGAVLQAAGFGGGVDVYRVSDFGRRLLADLDAVERWR